MLKFQFPPALRMAALWGGVGLLALLNYLLVWSEIRRPDPSEPWLGPLMPGKPLTMTERPPSKQVLPPEEAPYKDEPLRDLVVREESVPKVAGEKPTVPLPQMTTPVTTPPPSTGPKSVAAKEEGSKPEYGKAESSRPSPIATAKPFAPEAEPSRSDKGFMVEAGRFILKLGADTLIQRMQKQGLKPRIVTSVEMVQLNSVQAGPFTTLALAKEAEVKLKAGGLDATVEESWDGHILFLGKFHMLGHAVQTMELAEQMEVKPVRLIKVEAPLTLFRVLIGPYPAHETAKEVSAKIANSGLAVPVILKWPPDEKNDDPTGNRDREFSGVDS